MKNILVTGATGNIGKEVIYYLNTLENNNRIIAAVRDISKAKTTYSTSQDISYRTFDFKDKSTFTKALHAVDILFLLRPPEISEVNKYFKPLLEAAKKANITKIVFLSVQGVERSKAIPHHKIEILIKNLDFEFIFIRPSYFMQNLTTTLLSEIKSKQKITLPSGKAKFNWVDVKNIGEAAAVLINDFSVYKNQALEITGSENLNFYEVTKLIDEETGIPILYNSVNPIKFYFVKRKERIPSEFIIVMLLLHFLPRFQKEPKISNWYKKLTSKTPTKLATFIKREKESFLPLSITN